LKKWLKQMQSRNAFMMFMLCKDMVKDIMKHHFSSEFEDKTMLECQDANNLKNLAENIEHASNTSTNNYN